MDKSNGYSRKKYEMHSVTYGKAKESGMDLGSLYQDTVSFILLCVKAHRRKSGCSMDYLSALKTSLNFTHKSNISSCQTNLS